MLPAPDAFVMPPVAAPAPTWTDIGSFWATVGGVTVTFVAVLVALFGPQLRETWKRPVITMSPMPERMGHAVWPHSSALIGLRLHNQHGRDTALDVEVFVVATYRRKDHLTGMKTTGRVAGEANLNFDDPLSGGPGRPTATVPSGFRGTFISQCSHGLTTATSKGAGEAATSRCIRHG